MERTEDQIVFNEMSLIFGGKRYRIKKLTIRQTREWLKKVFEKDGSVAQQAASTEVLPERINILSSAGFEALESLVVDYCNGSVTADQIEDGTPEELEEAYNQLLETSGFFALIWGKTRRLTGKA